jgi:hypothetical protein
MSVPRPDKTRIEIVAAPDVLTASIPAKGIFSIWGIFVLVGVAATGMSVIPFLVPIPANSPLLYIRFLFPLFGLTFFLTGLQAAYRRTAIVVAGGSLTISHSGPLRKSERTWERDEIEWIKIGPSSVTVNNRRLPQLQVIAKTMKNEGFLTGYSEEELEWVADQIRLALRLSAATTSESPIE